MIKNKPKFRGNGFIIVNSIGNKSEYKNPLKWV